jgi:hypothetical protein
VDRRDKRGIEVKGTRPRLRSPFRTARFCLVASTFPDCPLELGFTFGEIRFAGTDSPICINLSRFLPRRATFIKEEKDGLDVRDGEGAETMGFPVSSGEEAMLVGESKISEDSTSDLEGGGSW